MDHIDVAIIGGGAAGAITAVALRRCSRQKLTAMVIDKAPEPGRGIAYSTPHSCHLLNVPAGKMSAIPSEGNHFVQWLVSSPTSPFAGRSPESLEAVFVPRRLYGQYLNDLFKSENALHRRDECVSLKKEKDHFILNFENGPAVYSRHVVLALGHGAPHIPKPFETVKDRPGFLSPPWDFERVRQSAQKARRVFILGTGLTMVDCVLSLTMDGWDGKIVALSRHGLLPHGHRRGGPQAAFPLSETTGPLSKLLKTFRGVVIKNSAAPWQSHFDALRPRTQALWQALSSPEKERFLRHLRPYWEVHRHRMAPEIFDEIQKKMETRQLEIRGGRVKKVEASMEGFTVTFDDRHLRETVQTQADVIINATGPLGHVEADRRPLVRDLLEQGLIKPDPLAMGIQVTENLQALDEKGQPVRGLYTLGGLTRGWGWEVTAVPDIRVQAWNLGQAFSQVGP